MDLLERDVALLELNSAMTHAERGEGRVVLVSGEAGIGKTALLQQFARAHRPASRILWGACDALFTPRPFGPLHDIAAMSDGKLPMLLRESTDRATIFSALLNDLQTRPVVAVFEDVHWADEATLDLLRYIGRRIGRTSAVVVLTYRDDELGTDHPLRTLLGDLPSSSAGVVRLRLGPLSEQAVRVLVGHRPIDAVALHRQTGGNPFFVSELLSSGGAGLPVTVRDAVLGRVARLSGRAQAVLEVAAVVGPRIEPWLLEAMLGAEEAAAADECLARGVLAAHGDGLAFRHELARQAVLESIPALRRTRLHRLALNSLRAPSRGEPDLTRLAHHAEAAGDSAAVLEYAPAAARQASVVSAHRAAAMLFALALRFADRLSRADHATLASEHAWECHVSGDPQGAISSQREAANLWQTLGEFRLRGESLVRLASFLSNAGERNAARAACQQGIDLLETIEPGRELAHAYCLMSLLHQFNHDLYDAIALAERAIPIAEAAGDAQITGSAYNVHGLALMYLDYERGRQQLEYSLSVASAAGLDWRIATAYGNLGSNACELFHLFDAERYLAEGLAYTAERDLDNHRLYVLSWLAAVHLYRGRWRDAEDAAEQVIHSPITSSNSRWAAVLALGRLQARRGEAAAQQMLDDALSMGTSMGEFQVVVPVRAARAETAWLQGDRAATLAETDAAYALAVAKQHHWVAGELAFWRCGLARASHHRTGSRRRTYCRYAATGGPRPTRGKRWGVRTRRRARWRTETPWCRCRHSWCSRG
jgi:hypothetical protein